MDILIEHCILIFSIRRKSEHSSSSQNFETYLHIITVPVTTLPFILEISRINGLKCCQIVYLLSFMQIFA